MTQRPKKLLDQVRACREPAEGMQWCHGLSLVHPSPRRSSYPLPDLLFAAADAHLLRQTYDVQLLPICLAGVSNSYEDACSSLVT